MLNFNWIRKAVPNVYPLILFITKKEPMVIEISYEFSIPPNYNCKGFGDENLILNKCYKILLKNNYLFW
jgi:hypothetical protein